MIIASKPGDIDNIIALTHAAIYDYRLEPGDINIIIALRHAQIYDYRLQPGDIDHYRLDTPQFMIIASAW
jgi:hypothetical protein